MSAAARRITHLVENLERGGLERVVVDLVREQKRRGHAVEVLCVFAPGLLAAELESDGVPVVACHKRGGLDLRAIARIRARLLAHGTQVLHTHNPVPHYHGMLAAAGLPVRVRVNTRHGMGNAPFARRKEALYRLTRLATDTYVTVCDSALANFVRHGILPASRSVAVPNGIPLDRFPPRTPQAVQAARERLGMPGDGPLVGIVGRLNPVKDHATLLEAMAIVAASDPRARLAVVGGGPLQAGLEALAASRGLAGTVRFLGDRSDVQALLPAFDVFALSSLSEGYSIALLEACAAGLPIVATRVGGNGEIVRDGVNGVLVPASQPEPLAAALAALLRDPARREALGAAGRAWVSGAGSVASMADRYEEIYGRAAT